MQKILVIEDEEAILSEVMDWLMFEGYEPVGATNGLIGIELALHESPALIICDIAMPKMDGYQVLLEVRSHPQLYDTPFIFVTASADRTSLRKGMALGADDYITKPFSHGDLMTSIHARLEKKQQLQTAAQRQVELLRRALEDERKQRLLKSRLVAMFSHDFKNPLATIMSSADLMLHYDDKLSTERKQDKLKRIMSSVGELQRMLDEMLMVAELESDAFMYNPTPTDVTHLVKRLVQECKYADSVSPHRWVVDSHVHQALAVDPKIIRQVLSNLLANALKYSPGGSEIRVTVAQLADTLVLAVRDQGIGIPEDAIAGLFEPFQRAENALHVKGTGLGLTIVKQAVDVCNGTIHVESEEGRGATFTVHLPIGAP